MRFRAQLKKEAATLHGQEGELLSIRVRVHPRLLEDLLEALAGADFPINPEIRHGHPDTTVEFPAYETQLPEIRRLVTEAGAGAVEMEIPNVLRTTAS